jgi:hypothetical protein
MKRITAFCLVVGLMIACTENESVKVEQLDAFQNVPSVLYKGKLYRSDDEQLRDYILSSSISLQFDFEEYIRLFDTEADLREFLRSSQSGKYEQSITKLLHPEESEQITNSKTPLGSPNRPTRSGIAQSRTQNTIDDFELVVIDGRCSTYPVQAWYVDLQSFPSGVISSLPLTVGYLAFSFEFEVPPGGSISLLYKGLDYPTHLCQARVYVATATGCHEPYYFMCSSSEAMYAHGPAAYLNWNVDIGS